VSDKRNKSLKPGWRQVKFGDVVQLSKARSQDPLADGFERYVGLEHLEPGDLRIRSWGNVADGVTFTSVFQPGQVLFGKRRAYQRKVAVADFSGVCSGDIYVLETKDSKVLLPELLPFICQTDAFFDHAVGTSAGSLSPRTNWSSLAEFQFSLPSIQDQPACVETLRSAAAHAASFEHLAGTNRALMKSAIMDFFGREDIAWTWEPIGSVGDVQLGQQKHPKYEAGIAPKPYLRVVNIGDGDLVLDDVKSMDFVGRDFTKHRLQPGDVLVTEGDLVSAFNVGRAAIFRGEIEDCCVQKSLIRFRPRPGIQSEYVLAAFRFLRYAGHFAQAASTTTVSHLVANKFERVLMPIAPPEYRQDLIGLLSDIAGSQERVDQKAQKAAELKQSLEQVVWGAASVQ
jgi:type I restriction enzyme S subunit